VFAPVGGSLDLSGCGRGYVVVGPRGRQKTMVVQALSNGRTSGGDAYSLLSRHRLGSGSPSTTSGSLALRIGAGDGVEAEFAGMIVLGAAGVVRYAAAGRVVGGTGRLSDARGQLAIAGELDFATGRCCESVAMTLSIAQR